MTVEDLKTYSDAWNAHDIDAIMAFMTEDCEFETGGGHDAFGTRFEGAVAVRARFEQVWADIPDARFVDAVHFVQGQQGCSEWRFTGHRVDGSEVDIMGCDIFTFEGDKIRSKRSYIKLRS